MGPGIKSSQGFTTNNKVRSVRLNKQHDVSLINIIGIDGAGKTTLARQLAMALQQDDQSIRYKYCQYFPKLLYPLKLLAKVTLMRGTDHFEDYDHYNQTRKHAGKRYPIMANLYACVWMVDYLAQVFINVTPDLLSGKKLIIDRYIHDVAINLSLTTNNDVNYAKKLISGFFRFAPEPDLTLIIDLPEEVAYARKNDIQAISYLSERRERYLSLADGDSIQIIDGDQPPELVLQTALNTIRASRPGFIQHDMKPAITRDRE